MKICTKCSCEKPLEDFYTQKAGKQGRMASCKACQNAKSTLWARMNRERTREIRELSRRNNLGADAAKTAKRRSAVLNSTPCWANMTEIQRIYKMSASLQKLLKRPTNVDHIIPLQGEKVSGLHVPDNLQITFAEANQAKSNNYEVV